MGFVVEVDAVDLGVLAGALHVGRPIGLHACTPSELMVMRAEYEDSVPGSNSSDGVSRRVAITIDTDSQPPHILLVRGSVGTEIVNGVPGEYLDASKKYVPLAQ